MTNEHEVAQVPFFVHEGELTRLERINKRLWIAVLVVFAAFVLSNLAWIIYENQYTDVEYSYQVDQESQQSNTYTNNRVTIGGVTYGTTEGDDPGATPRP